MKSIKSLFLLTSLLLAGNAFADKITISGEPVVVEQKGDVYVVPSTVKSSDYYYFTVNNTKQVCYKEVQPALAKVDLGLMKFKMGEDTVEMHCYTYSPDYFVVSP